MVGTMRKYEKRFYLFKRQGSVVKYCYLGYFSVYSDLEEQNERQKYIVLIDLIHSSPKNGIIKRITSLQTSM